MYSTARSRDLPPPQPAASQRRGDDAGASSSVAWLNEFLESTQTGSSQAGSRGAQTAGSDVWAGLPVPPNVSDMSDDEVNAVMGRLLEQISQVGAHPLSANARMRPASVAAVGFTASLGATYAQTARHLRLSGI